MASAYTTVHRTSDPIEAEILGDLLEKSGIPARVLGTRNAPLIGVAQHIMELRIEVPGLQARQALEVIDAYHGARAPLPDEEDEEDEGACNGVDTAAAEPRTRSHLMALGAVVAIFGGCHFYSRRTYTAVILALGQAGALTFGLAGLSPEAPRFAGFLFGLLLLCDLVGAQLAVRAYNRGARPRASRQVAGGLVLLLASVAAAALLTSTLEPAPPTARAAAVLPAR